SGTDWERERKTSRQTGRDTVRCSNKRQAQWKQRSKESKGRVPRSRQKQLHNKGAGSGRKQRLCVLFYSVGLGLCTRCFWKLRLCRSWCSSCSRENTRYGTERCNCFRRRNGRG